MSEAFAPAETYQLNTLASVVGRYGVSNPSTDTLRQIDGMLESVIGQLVDGDVPPVPHTDPELLKEAAAFDLKLLRQVETGPAASYMSAAQQGVVRSLLTQHVDFCSDRRLAEAPWRRLIEPQAVADAYGLPELWKHPSGVIYQEIDTWGRDTQHPAVPPILRKQVEIGSTRDLMDFMWRRVVEVPNQPQVTTYLTDEVQNYHVFWAPVADGGLDYATPRNYDRAIQLSFDLPHNATHLAHLDAMDKVSGARRYDDSMALRAYFEAVTVFSEHKAYELATSDPAFGAELADILQLGNEMTPEEIAAWVAEDRKYEFKLRAVRYAADALLMQGVAFDDTVANVQQQFGISRSDAEKETRKYIAWTGLGAAYTFGYRQLLANGITRTIDAIKNSNGEVITAWQESPRT